MSRTASVNSASTVIFNDRSLGLSDGQRRVPRSKPLVLKSDARQASNSSSTHRIASRCSTRGPLGTYHAASEDSEEEREAISRRISQASSQRLSSMNFYQLTHPEQGASRDSSPDVSPLTTPFGSSEKLETDKKHDSYLFPLPPSGAQTTRRDQPLVLDLQPSNFNGLGLDTFGDAAVEEASSATPVPFAPEFYDSDGLTGSQGWSPSTYAPSQCPSPLADRSPSLGGHSRSVSFTQPLSIRKTSSKHTAEDESMMVHEDNQNDDVCDEDQRKLSRLQSSLALLGLRDEAEHIHDDQASNDAASESSPKTSPMRLDARMFYSPEHGAPSLAEQLAFACGNGYHYEVEDGVSHHDSALDYLPLWLQQRLEQTRRDSVDSMGLNPLSGLSGEVGDSWTDAHGHGSDALSRNNSRRSNRTSIYTSLGSPILSGPMAASSQEEGDWLGAGVDSTSVAAATAAPENETEEFPKRRLSQPRLSLSPHLSSLREFSYLTLFGDGGVEAQQAAAPSSNAEYLFSPPLSTPELERQCEGTGFLDRLDSFPSPVPARPSSIGMQPFAMVLNEGKLPKGLTGSKSMVNLHAKRIDEDDKDDVEEVQAEQTIEMDTSATSMFDPATRPAMPKSQSTASILNRGRPVRQCTYLERKPDVITVTRNKPSLSSKADGRPAMPSRAPPAVPKRSSSMGRLSASAEIRQSYLEQSKAEEFAAKVETEGISPPVQLIPGHRNSGSKSMLTMDKGMLFAPVTPRLPSEEPRGSVCRPAIDLHAGGRPRTLSREASIAMKQAQREASASSSNRKMSKSSSTSSVPARPLFSTSIFRKSNSSTASLPKASKSVADLRGANIGPKDEVVAGQDVVSTQPAGKLKSKKSEAKLAKSSVKTEPRQAPPTNAHPQIRAISRPSLNNAGFLRSPAQDNAVFPASQSMPILFVARTQSQRKRGETGIPETTPSPLLPSHFRSGKNRHSTRATRWSSAQALMEGQDAIREEREPSRESERSALPTPTGCVLVVEEHVVSEERTRVM